MTRDNIKKNRQKKINQILKTATKIFAQKGYDGASVNVIAEKAGISKRSMYYYTGDKETLYDNVLNEQLNNAIKHIKIEITDNLTPKEKIKKYIQGIAQVANIPELHSIVIRELLSGGKNLPDGVHEGLGLGLTTIINILKEGQENGDFRDVNEIVLPGMIFGTLVFWNLIVPLIHKNKEYKEKVEELGLQVNDRVTEETIQLILQILEIK